MIYGKINDREGAKMDALEYALSKKPVVTAINGETHLQEVLRSSSNVTFLLNADIMTLSDITEQLQAADKLVFVHLDLMSGVARDASGVRYLAEVVGVDGIVTTRSQLIPIAKKNRLITIQRTFILDSVSANQTLKVMNDSRPDALEVLPAPIIPHVMGFLTSGGPKSHIIGGGLLSTIADARTVLDSGCIGISSSAPRLWQWQDDGFPDD